MFLFIVSVWVVAVWLVFYAFPICGLCLCVCVCFCRNINNGKMMILVVAPVLQASLYLMLHGDWHTLFLIPQQTHQKNLIFVLFFCKESMQRRRDDCYPYKSVYITTWWFYNMHYHLISFCSFQFLFFIVFFFNVYCAIKDENISDNYWFYSD